MHDDGVVRAERLMLRVRAGDPIALEGAIIREFDQQRDACYEADALLADECGRAARIPDGPGMARYIAERIRERKVGPKPSGM